MNDNFRCAQIGQFGEDGCIDCIWNIRDAQANPCCFFYELRDSFFQVREKAINIIEEDYDEAHIDEVLDRLLGNKKE